MTDSTTTGWQNVLRLIRRELTMRTPRDHEPALHPVETAEREAWQVAYDAVLDRLARMDDGRSKP